MKHMASAQVTNGGFWIRPFLALLEITFRAVILCLDRSLKTQTQGEQTYPSKCLELQITFEF